MTETLIVLLIAYMIFSKIRSRGVINFPERPNARYPWDTKEILPNYTSSDSEDGPLPGPWQTLPRSEDRPLSGPWEKPTANEDGPLPGPWDKSSRRGKDVPLPGRDKPQPQLGGQYEPSLPRQEQTNPAVNPPLAQGEHDRDRMRRAIKITFEGDGCYTDQAENPLPQAFPATAPKRRKHNAGNSLAAGLHSKNALVGSIIIGEVLNSRGGRMRKRK